MKLAIEFDKIPGNKKLFLDYLSGRVAERYHHHFGSESSLTAVKELLSKRTYDRAKIVETLTRQNKSFAADSKTLENIQKLLNPETTAVFTGQQVSIFGGPLFVYYKAALAVKLAETNCRRLNSEVVPIFWLAADDADFAEVASISLPGKEERVATFSYQPDTAIDAQPMGSVKFDNAILRTLDQYESLLPDTEFRAELMALLRDAYRPGESIVTAFAKYLNRLFKGKGLILIDPSDPVFRQLALPVFKKELKLREEGARLVAQSNQLLEDQDYHLQVAKPGSYANLFFYNGKRSRIDFVTGGFGVEGKHYSQEQFEKMLTDSPSLFSPNVFLRPIVQSHIFPTLIYFAGPAEAAYFSQIKELFDLFDEVAPVIYPRFSATIVEPNINRLMEKYGLSYVDFTGEIGHLVNEVLKRSFPADFAEEFTKLREEVKSRLGAITKNLDSSDHGLITNAERMTGKIDIEIKNLEEKIFQAHKKKNQTVRQQLERVAFNLFPDRTPQERVFPINYYIAKYGFGVIDQLYAAVDCNSKVHHLIMFEDQQKEAE